jgi:hypothetical protein
MQQAAGLTGGMSEVLFSRFLVYFAKYKSFGLHDKIADF